MHHSARAACKKSPKKILQFSLQDEKLRKLCCSKILCKWTRVTCLSTKKAKIFTRHVHFQKRHKLHIFDLKEYHLVLILVFFCLLSNHSVLWRFFWLTEICHGVHTRASSFASQNPYRSQADHQKDRQGNTQANEKRKVLFHHFLCCNKKTYKWI